MVKLVIGSIWLAYGHGAPGRPAKSQEIGKIGLWSMKVKFCPMHILSSLTHVKLLKIHLIYKQLESYTFWPLDVMEWVYQQGGIWVGGPSPQAPFSAQNPILALPPAPPIKVFYAN